MNTTVEDSSLGPSDQQLSTSDQKVFLEHRDDSQINSDFIRGLLQKHGTIVMAHRGGNWSADNSITNFKAAIENKVEGVETDVWLSKDGVPMIVHGGDDGQLALYGLP